MLQSLKIRLYPDIEQQIEMNKLVGSCRFAYNYCLGLKIDAYKSSGATLSMGDLNKEIIQLKNTEEYDGKFLHSLELAFSFRRLEIPRKYLGAYQKLQYYRCGDNRPDAQRHQRAYGRAKHKLEELEALF